MIMLIRYTHGENACSCYAWQTKFWEEFKMSTDLQMLHSCDGVTKNYKSVITHFYDTFQCIVPTEVTLKWAGHGEERNAYKILLRKLDGRTSLRRSMHRWEDNTKMDLREIDLED
jgi:hypothetical protein